MYSRIMVLAKNAGRGVRIPSTLIRRCRPPIADARGDLVLGRKTARGKVGLALDELSENASAIFPKFTQNLKSICACAKKEMSPPKTADDAKVVLNDVNWFLDDMMKKRGWRDMSVREAWLYFLVGLEIIFWFFAGETIGKFHFVGYPVLGLGCHSTKKEPSISLSRMIVFAWTMFLASLLPPTGADIEGELDLRRWATAARCWRHSCPPDCGCAARGCGTEACHFATHACAAADVECDGRASACAGRSHLRVRLCVPLAFRNCSAQVLRLMWEDLNPEWPLDPRSRLLAARCHFCATHLCNAQVPP